MVATTLDSTNNEHHSLDASAPVVAEEDVLRANFYGLLARVLASPLDDESMDVMRGLAEHDDESELGQAIAAFGKLCVRTTVAKANEEFTELFYGFGAGGELTPYGSFYITGLIYDKPLADLRGDMSRLGVESDPSNQEPEDHISSVCEIMQGILTKSFDGQAPDEARSFFHKHIAPWAGQFFEDLEKAPSAVLYMPVGTIGRLFIEIEREAFEMAA